MTRWWMIAGMVCLLSGGCAPSESQLPPEEPRPQLVVQPTGAEKVLACVQETRALSRSAFKEAYGAASKQAAADDDSGPSLRLVCLSLHEFARYRQFKAGVETMENYLTSHPDEAGGMGGLLLLLQRLDREKSAKWAQQSRWIEEKDGLVEENKALLERNGQLEKTVEQDQGRIRDLQTQIEQLKNIENIIKHRDR